MIKATLRPPTITAELLVDTHRRVTALARQEQSALLQKARKRGKIYSKKARELAARQGFAKGLEECRSQYADILDKIQNLYSVTVESAKRDVLAVAHRIVEETISSYLQEHPEQLATWVTESLERLKHARTITLKINPRYTSLLSPLLQRYQGTISTIEDPSLEEIDFSVETNIGGLSFSWRELLRPLSKPEYPGER